MSTEKKNMNIVLVIFDSLRKDCISTYGSPPWWEVHTPHLDAFAKESLVMTRAFPECLPTLPARRAIYTGSRVYPFRDGDIRLKGDFCGSAGWGPIPEEQPTLSEMLQEAGYRTALVSDLYHMFKPSKNFWRGFDQWNFIRGQEMDLARSGPMLGQEEIDHWLPSEMQGQFDIELTQQSLMNMYDLRKEEEYFPAQVFREASTWLEQNKDTENFFLTVESFDPHEPWLVPDYYRKMYLDDDGGRELVKPGYGNFVCSDRRLLDRVRANYSGEVTLCDRWFGHFMDSLRVQGLLENTMVVVFADHGHSLGERGFVDNEAGFLGKTQYPSAPEVFEVPLMVRFPGAQHAGASSDMFVLHTDITATILQAAGVQPAQEIDGRPFLDDALAGKPGPRDHATVGWGSTPTVVTDRWWFNCKCDGTGALLHDLRDSKGFDQNVAQDHQEVVDELFAVSRDDAGGSFPEWLVELAKSGKDAPGCSHVAART